MRNWILVLGSLLVLVGCGDNAGDSGGSIGDSGGSAGDISDPPEDSGNSASVDGAAVYSQRCTVCHGADGQRRVPSLVVFVPGSSQAELTDIVTNGVRSMPAFRSSLTEKEIADVVQFLLSEWGTG
jgi:mono/diheme cytochrome c family protein